MSASRINSAPAKRAFFIFFGLMTLFVLYRYELPLLDSESPAWQHFANVKLWLIPHGIAGAIALFLAPFQFSTRIRQRNPRLHRILGRLYVGGVAFAAPSAIPIAIILGPPALVMAAIMQSTGWMLTTAIALYCIRTGNIQQHREWMMRSYPFAMVFVFARVLMAIPAIQALGEVGFISVVWSCEVAAAFIPSLVISWSALFRRKAAPAAKKLRAAA
jgi:uncharacterized membrane protein